MNSVLIAVVVFASVFGAALVGMWLRGLLPKDHLSPETKDSVRLGMGLVSTMAALVLGLLVASAKESYDRERNEVIQMSAKIGHLDALLAEFGPQAADARVVLRSTVERAVVSLWPDREGEKRELAPSSARSDALFGSIHRLSAETDTQRSIKSEAISLVSNLGQSRWLLFEQAGGSISLPLLVVLISWLAIIFASFGLFAPPNSTAIGAMLVAAVSVAGAIFLILELARPFDGFIQISSTPVRNALEQIGK